MMHTKMIQAGNIQVVSKTGFPFPQRLTLWTFCASQNCPSIDCFQEGTISLKVRGKNIYKKKQYEVKYTSITSFPEPRKAKRTAKCSHQFISLCFYTSQRFKLIKSAHQLSEAWKKSKVKMLEPRNLRWMPQNDTRNTARRFRRR